MRSGGKREERNEIIKEGIDEKREEWREGKVLRVLMMIVYFLLGNITQPSNVINKQHQQMFANNT